MIAFGLLVTACGEEEPVRPPTPQTELTVTVRPQGPGGERRTPTRRMPCRRRESVCPVRAGSEDIVEQVVGDLPEDA